MIIATILTCLALISPARAAEPSSLQALEAQAGLTMGAVQLGNLRGYRPPPQLYSAYLANAASAGAPLAEIPLPPLLDIDRYTSAVFMAGNVRVHVFGTKSENKNNWFVEFWPENEPQPIFVKGWDILHYKLGFIPIVNHTYNLTINQHSYQVYINGQVQDKMESKLIIAPEGRHGKKTVFTIKQLVRDAYETGYPLQLGNKSYRLIYSQGFMESDDGHFERYAQNRAVIFLSMVNGHVGGFHVFEDQIPHAGRKIMISYPSPLRQNSEDYPDYTRVGLSIGSNKTLKIYYPVR